MLKIWHLLLLCVAAALCGGCSELGYYTQAVAGHLEVMRAARPIDELLRDPGGDARLKARLAEVQAIRQFASRELGLPDNDSYRAYADIGRPYVVWNVFAAPPLSLQPRSWCLLVVGCVNYRGYYARLDAQRLAAELSASGYDTYIGGVPAYSTLGHFSDPVLNTFLRLGDAEVARTVFHELAHQLIFVPDDSMFNESFATAVENEGLRRWLAAHATPAQRNAYELQRQRKTAVAALLRQYREQFNALYAANGPLLQQRQAKAALYDTLRHDYAGLKAGWDGYAGYDGFFADDLNNAKLVSVALYSELVPAFEALLAEEHYALPRFYQRVAALAALGKEARHNLLRQRLAATKRRQ